MNKIDATGDLALRLPQRGGKGGQRLCIVTAELEGPHFNGGVGTTNRALALTLTEMGHEVDILYTMVSHRKPHVLRGTFIEHVEIFKELGIRLLSIDDPTDLANWLAKSYFVLQHLIAEHYDLVFFDDLLGAGYYPLLARKTGCRALRTTKMCVTAHGALEWVSELNQPLLNYHNLALPEMERRSIELADVVKAPSAYILRKYRDYGWSVPDNFIVMPNFVSARIPPARPSRPVDVRELVFFGRLEPRKGYSLFCRALDRLKYKLEIPVTFLGKATTEFSDDLIQRSAAWPFPIRLIDNFNRDQAIAYLKGDGRLAVMPSTEDNSPSVILECLEEGIPFLASSGGGGAELVDSSTRESNFVEPTVRHLVGRLTRALAEGVSPGVASFDPVRLRESFGEWIETSQTWALPQPSAADPSFDQVTLLVVVPPDWASRQAAGELRRLLGAFGNAAEIWALTADRAGVEDAFSGSPLGNVKIGSFEDFGQIANEVANSAGQVVGICHISQALTLEWVARASACFSLDPTIGALTGMVASKSEPEREKGEDYVARTQEPWKVDRFLSGSMPPLFALTIDTNSGFVLLRKKLLAKVAEIPPIEPLYARLKRMREWIHEMLLVLHEAGERFELVPDLTVRKPVVEDLFEAQLIGDFMRRHATRGNASNLNSDFGLATRLAVDGGLEQEARGRSEEYLRRLGERLGLHVPQVAHNTSIKEHNRQLATLAHAAGQIDLAVDLALALTTSTNQPQPVTELIGRRATTIHLSDFLESRKFDGINFAHIDSFMTSNGGRVVELRTNPASRGKMTLYVPDVEITAGMSFLCRLRIADVASGPARVRLDLLYPEGPWTAEKVLRAGETAPWRVDLPEPRSEVLAAVVLSVERPDPRDTAPESIVEISDARFEVSGGRAA